MQRKNNFLKRSKRGLALIMAIMVIIIISTILALALMMNSQTSKSTADLYLYEQSRLLARSAAEYAVFKIGVDNNDTNRCSYTGEVFTENTIYNIAINVNYIYDDTTSACGAIDLTQDTPFGAALIDVSVEVPKNVVGESIRVFNRKLIEI